MHVLSLQGNHYEMGYQHGLQVFDLRPLIIAAIDRRLARRASGRQWTVWLAEVEQAWARLAPATLDMLRGMAQALDLDGTRLFEYAVASYLEDRTSTAPSSEACTVWAASGPATTEGMPMLSKNRDYSLGHVPLQAVVHARPQQGYNHLYVTSAGSPAVFSSGMNEVGLAIADTHVLSTDLGPGLARYTLMMELLQGHSSVASALKYLQEVPRMGGGNLILVDAQGEMAVFETGYRYWGVISPANHFVVATNHFATPSLRTYNAGRASGQANDESEARYYSVRQLLTDGWGNLDGERAKQIMACHADGGIAICRHEADDDSSTISNVIFFPTRRHLLFCNGRPCESTYTSYSL